MLLSSRRAEVPANFLAAPAPDFFPKRLRLRLLFFFQAAPAPALFGTFFFQRSNFPTAIKLEGLNSRG